MSLHGNCTVKIFTSYGKVCRIIFNGLVNLVPTESERCNHIGCGMGFREHILNFHTRINIPFGNIVFTHSLEVFFRKKFCCVTFTDNLHYFKCHARFKTFVHKISHNRVTSTDYFRNCTGSVMNKFLSVYEPYIGTVRKTCNLQKVGKGFGLCLNEHSSYESRTAFRKAECTGF